MTRLIVAALCALLSTAAVARPAPDSRLWFETEYAPLWSSQRSNANRIASFYRQVGFWHPSSEEMASWTSSGWIIEYIDQAIDDGWTTSQPASLAVETVNPYTVIFKARWRDQFGNGATEESCDWYIADRTGDRGVFANHADINCVDHRLQ